MKYGYDKSGKPFLTKEPKLLLNDNFAGKPEGIHLEIGARPIHVHHWAGFDTALSTADAGGGVRRDVWRLMWEPSTVFYSQVKS